MKIYRSILVIGGIEIFIGSVTLTSTFISLMLNINTKTPNVLFFVIVSALLSTLIGIGIMQLSKEALWLLLYFSSVVFLSKTLIFMGIIQLNGALSTMIAPQVKNILSMLYHGFVILYLSRKELRTIFH